MGGERCFGFKAYSVVVVVAGQVHVNLALVQIDAVTFALGFVQHLADDAAVGHGIRINPSAQREAVFDVITGDVARIQFCFAVKHAGRSDAPRGYRHFLLVFEGNV